MDFIYKLFPYRSLFIIDDETLTAWWVMLIFILFIYNVIKLLIVTLKLKGSLSKLSETPTIEGIQSNKLFASIWKDYEKSFFLINNQRKTDEYAYEYFNEKNLLAINANVKLISSIPNLLIGFGILGTFVGLTFGISDFKTNSIELIQESIQTLLSGMGTAFVSSIWGMLFSIMFTYHEKILVNSLHNSIHQFCYRLDRNYKISTEDERAIAIHTYRKLLSEYFIFADENNNMVKPANVLRDIYQESKKQSQALQSFSTDLANLIEEGFKKIINDPDNGVNRELKKLQEEIIDLGKKIQSPANEMTQSIVNDLQQTMAKMMEDFKSSLSGTAKAEMENLAILLSQAGSTLTDLPDKIQYMSNAVQVQVDDMSENLKKRVEDLQIGQELLLTKQSENIQLSEGLLSSFNKNIDKLNELAIEVSETVAQFHYVEKELSNVTAQLNGISQNVLSSTTSFQNAQVRFTEYSNDFLEKNTETIQNMSQALTQAKALAENYAQKFEIIEEGLQGIFGEIQSGLIEYRDTVGQSLESYLGKYTDALTNTSKSLENANTALNEFLEELNENLSNYKQK